MIFIAMGSMLLLFWVLITMTALTNYSTTFTSFNLRFEREELVTSLMAARDQTQKKNQELQKEIDQRVRAEVALRSAHDLLEEKVVQRTAELQSVNNQLKNANRELSSFTRSVTHDLRAPLFSIEQFGIILEEEGGACLNDDAQEALLHIRKSAQRMKKLINDLLLLSSVSQSDLNVESVNLSLLVNEITGTLQKRNPERTVESIVQQDVIAQCDSRLIHIALENLIDNAWKYTGKTGHARVEFGMFQRETETVYYVKDNGAGFDMKLAGKLFTPFQRLHSEKAFSGTGVGLSTVQRIIGRHDGTIWAQSSPGQGAAFYFTLG